MKQPYRIAVFASGNGSNFAAIADAVAAGQLDVTIALLVCDNPQARVVKRAAEAGIPAFTFRPQDFPAREAYEQEILRRLDACGGVHLIVLAGYMRLLTNTIVQPFYGRMINIHPALLPAFQGKNGIRQALDYGVKLTGATVHYVDNGVDSGAIIAQQAVEVLDDDTEESLALRVHQVEYELYPRVIQWMSEGKVLLDGRKVTINN